MLFVSLALHQGILVPLLMKGPSHPARLYISPQSSSLFGTAPAWKLMPDVRQYRYRHRHPYVSPSLQAGFQEFMAHTGSDLPRSNGRRYTSGHKRSYRAQLSTRTAAPPVSFPYLWEAFSSLLAQTALLLKTKNRALHSSPLLLCLG